MTNAEPTAGHRYLRYCLPLFVAHWTH